MNYLNLYYYVNSSFFAVLYIRQWLRNFSALVKIVSCINNLLLSNFSNKWENAIVIFQKFF
jgi:hypothetical protein